MTGAQLRPEITSLLCEAYDCRLLGLFLFGSRARGDARKDSDYDILVVLRDIADLSREYEVAKKVSESCHSRLGIKLDLMPRTPAMLKQRTTLMDDVITDARHVWGDASLIIIAH